MGHGSAIRVENVSKKFAKSLRQVMLYGARDILLNSFGFSTRSNILRKGEFWAVRDVSFEVKKGETLGVVGSNGSGKSTILKMINGIYMPDAGRIEITGRVGALIEVGAGFHPMLTGRENVYLNGTILGMSKAEIDQKYNDIVAFADIGDFIDSPVRHYSSGMFVRLGMAIAVHSEPEILLVDEVLAVGDVGFMNKTLNYLMNVLDKSTVVLVSHNMAHIRRLCDRVVVLDGGAAVFDGEPDQAVARYLELSEARSAPLVERSNRDNGSAPVELRNITAYPVEADGSKIDRANIMFEEDFAIEAEFFLKDSLDNPEFRLSINVPTPNVLAVMTTSRGLRMPSTIEQGRVRVTFMFKKPILFPREYFINVAVADEKTGHYYMGAVDVLRLRIDYQPSSRFPDMEVGAGITCIEKEILVEAL